MMAGVNPAAVQRILRHHDPRITTEIYGHLEPGYLRTEIDSLRFAAPSPPRPDEARAVCNAPSFAAPVLHDSQGCELGSLHMPPKAEQFPAIASVRHSGFEPLAFGSGGRQAGGDAARPGEQFHPHPGVGGTVRGCRPSGFMAYCMKLLRNLSS
jgi:hypothetical protein